MTVNTDKLTAAAAFLRAARVGDWPADLPSELIPTDRAEGYKVQDLVIGDEGVAGWKILATAAPEALSCAALAAPSLLPDGGTLPLGERLPEAEVEIAIRLVQDLPPRAQTYDRAEVLAALGPAHAAFEIVESRFNDRKAANPMSAHADAQSSRAFAIGEGVADWQRLDLPSLPITLTLDGALLAQKNGGASVTQVVDALVWLANHASTRGVGLKAGQSVITGARIGPLVIPPGQELVAVVDQIGEVRLKLA